MKNYFITLSTILLLSLPANIAYGYGYCSEPSKPYCADGYSFTNSYEYESCKSDMEIYLSKMKRYMECLDRNTSENNNEDVLYFNSKVTEKKREANRFVDSFNTMVRNTNNDPYF